jgi:hypothetical protein
VTRGRADRPPRWVLDLGLDVESGHRPWLHTLAGAPLMLGALLMVRLLTDMQPAGAQEREPDVTGVAEKLSGILSVLSWVLAGFFLVAGIVYWVVGRYAYGVWRSLAEEERRDLARERLEALRTAIVALGGDDPGSLGISDEDLADLSDRHRALVTRLRDEVEASPAPVHAAARACAGDLVSAARIHRMVVHPPQSPSSATDPRVQPLQQLDEEIAALAASLIDQVQTGECTCATRDPEALVELAMRARSLISTGR